MRLINLYRNLPLPLKIALFGVVSVILFIVMTSVIIRTTITDAVTDYGQQQVMAETALLQAQLVALERQLVNGINFIASSPAFSGPFDLRNLSSLRELAQTDGSTPQVDIVWLFNAQASPTLRLQGAPGALDEAQAIQTLVMPALADGTVETGFVRSGDGSGVYLLAARRLEDAENGVRGAVIVGRGVDSLFMDTLNFNRVSTHVGLISNGQVIATTTEGADELPDAGDAALVAQAQTGVVAVAPLAADNDGTPDIEAYFPIHEGMPGEVAFLVRVEYEPLFALQDNLLNGIRTGVIVAAFIISNLLVVLIQGGITRPFVRLTKQIERIAKGEYSERVPVKSTDEIGRLGASFNQMTDAVQAREAELKALNQTLEKRVEERTRELREARDVAVAAQRLAQENSRLKSEFLATMSHELRTPLNAIEGFSSIMLGGMGVQLSPVATDMMKRISANSKRLLHLINDFLDLSRIEAGRLDLVKEPIELRRLVRRWQDSVSILAEEKKLAFTVDIADDVPQTFVSDEDALTKIVTNLLSNAFKFTQKGSVSLTVRADGGRLTFAVRDTGIGIPVHARDYIFEEFRQVDGSSKREFGGTGLGLALVSKLSRLLDGSVSLDSEVGVGSTFTVEFPLVETEQGQLA